MRSFGICILVALSIFCEKTVDAEITDAQYPALIGQSAIAWSNYLQPVRTNKSEITMEQVKPIITMYIAITDADGSGKLEKQEVKAGWSQVPLDNLLATDENVNAFFKVVDKDESGGIDFVEALAYIAPETEGANKRTEDFLTGYRR